MYVGQTNNLDKRRREHKAKDRVKKNTPLYNAIKKYGFEKFDMITIDEFNTEQETDDAEKFWISFLLTRNRKYGYNIAEGGRVNRGYKHTEAFKINKSTQMKNYYATHKVHNFGVPCATNHKQLMSNMWRGDKSLSAKFTQLEVDSMRLEFSKTVVSINAFAAKYNVSFPTMKNILSNNTYYNEIYAPPYNRLNAKHVCLANAMSSNAIL